MTERLCRIASLVLLLTMGAVANAAESNAELAFDALSADEQRVLAGEREHWDEHDAGTRERLLNGARRWLELSPNERRETRQRWQRWQAMPQEQQRKLRQRMARFRELPAARREQLRETLRRFRQLPPAERQRLREQWQALPREERAAARQRMTDQAIARERQRRGRFRLEERQQIRRAIKYLDEAGRRALRERLRGAGPEQRREILLEFSRGGPPGSKAEQ